MQKIIQKLTYLGVTCKKADWNLSRISGFKNFWNWDFTTLWGHNYYHNLLNFEIQISYFTCKPNFVRRKIIFWKLAWMTIFSISSFYRGPRRKELGGREATETMTKSFVHHIWEKFQIKIYVCLEQSPFLLGGDRVKKIAPYLLQGVSE